MNGAPFTGKPLTLGTAGHIDHGKTTLVNALTGVDTDRLPGEKARGISIELGYAPLVLPSGRRLSVVDVPGHERFVRTMVAGATGIDLYLMVIAADDGVMPQTVEHATVLEALGVKTGVVAVTKADTIDPVLAAAEATELLPDAEIVVCSARTGEGIDDVRAALDRAAARLRGRGESTGAPVLHIDRAFTIRGAGTVVTGTLWSGAVSTGDRLALLGGREELAVRVRSVQVHDEPVERAGAGQRVAVNLAGLAVREVSRGDVVAAPGAIAPTRILDCDLQLRAGRHGMRVHVHHGTREAPARLADLGEGLWQARLERPLLARAGDRVVVRSIAPPDTLGGGTVLDPAARRHGRRPDVLARLQRLRRGEPEPEAPPAPVAAPAQAPEPQAAPLSPSALALEERLRAAAHEPPNETDLEAADLRALRDAGRAVRVGRSMYAHPDALAAVRARVERVIEAEGSITLARLRDELDTSRRYAQALLEHLDAERVTKRMPDDSRVLRRR
jgi:selenocysteine-specific elongation factor